jgi:hypothetical protein
VRHIVARPLALRGDSLVLEVVRLASPDHYGRESRPFLVAIPTTDSSVVIGVRRASRGRTGALILAVPFGAWLLFGLLYGNND